VVQGPRVGIIAFMTLSRRLVEDILSSSCVNDG